jgi:hypothetical protein
MKRTFAIISIISAAVLASFPGSASAAFVSQGEGDYESVPLYRALAYGSVNGEPNGVDYVSNIVPLPVANGNSTVIMNGAAFMLAGMLGSLAATDSQAAAIPCFHDVSQ